MSQRFVLIGHPVGHSLSPVIHAVAYRELGRTARYDLVDCPDEAAVAAEVDRVREGQVVGANVTVPHKRLALALADRVDESAEVVGAANVLSRSPEGEVVAHNTDARGLADDLRRLFAEGDSTDPDGTAAIIGNGGAALGAVVACQLVGMKRVVVVARRFAAELPRTEWPRADAFTRLGAEVVAWPSAADDAWDRAIRSSDLVIQATSAGMHGADSGAGVADLVPWKDLSRIYAYDLVYVPRETPFLAAASQTGHPHRGGLGMLVGQAARAIEIWWGELPPVAPLLQAANEALQR